MFKHPALSCLKPIECDRFPAEKSAGCLTGQQEDGRTSKLGSNWAVVPQERFRQCHDLDVVYREFLGMCFRVSSVLRGNEEKLGRALVSIEEAGADGSRKPDGKGWCTKRIAGRTSLGLQLSMRPPRYGSHYFVSTLLTTTVAKNR